MTNVITDLYNTAEIPVCNRPYYPFLSEEQQLRILDVLIKGRWVELIQYTGKPMKGRYYAGQIGSRACCEAETLEEAIAGLTVKAWKNLSEIDKNKVREILKK